MHRSIFLFAALALALSGCDGEVPTEHDAGAGADAAPSPMTDAAIDSGVDASEPPEPDASVPMERGTLAVLAGQTSTGYSDGTGAAARFNGAAGAALSADGASLYVADTFNSLIRRVDVATGAVTTLAGQVQQAAVVDGTGREARFDSPRALAITPAGDALFVADSGTIRRVALPSLEVTTVAGIWTMTGYVDGVGDEARFGFLVHDFAFSADGRTLYLADRSNRVLRALDTVSYEVTTVAGAPYTPSFPPQHADGTGADARMTLGGVTRVGDVFYFADTFNNCLRRFDPATGAVTTVAGDPTMEGNMDGVAGAATFETPQQLTGDADALYVTGFNGVLRRVRLSDFGVETLLGSTSDVRSVDGVGADVRFGVSFGPSPLGAGVLYFNDRDANSFRPVDLSTLEVTTLVGPTQPVGARDGSFAESRFHGPADLACAPDGVLCFVSDEWNHTIRVLDREAGTVATLAGAAGEPGSDDGAFADARFAGPTGLALDPEADVLYVADSANHTVRRLDLAARTVTTLAGAAELSGAADGGASVARFDSPEGLALDADGAVLFVADAGNGVLRRIELATATVGTLAGLAGEPGDDDGVGDAARFRSPSSLALSVDGATLYVADRAYFANVVRAVTLSTGEVTTVAGLAGERGVADGPVADARFTTPWDLLALPSGHLVLSDLGNGLIRRIDLGAGTVETWIGNVAVAGNPPAGAAWSLDEATLFFPGALARSGDDLLIAAEDAILVAKPEDTW